MNDDVSSFLSFTNFEKETWNTSWMFFMIDEKLNLYDILFIDSFIVYES
jgi:hypothetical protein